MWWNVFSDMFFQIQFFLYNGENVSTHFILSIYEIEKQPTSFLLYNFLALKIFSYKTFKKCMKKTLLKVKNFKHKRKEIAIMTVFDAE